MAERGFGEGPISSSALGELNSLSGSVSSLSVDPAEHGVDAGQCGDDVGDQGTLHHVRDRLEVDERRVPDVDAVGQVPAVTDDVVAQLAAGRLDGDVALPGRDLDALGHHLEVVDEGLPRLAPYV